jgi:hypothetical protein
LTDCGTGITGKTLDIYDMEAKTCTVTVTSFAPNAFRVTSPPFAAYPICTVVDLLVTPENQVIATSSPGNTFAKCREVAIQSGKNREIKE